MQSPETIRFMIDHMLIKLGKYLRILGYDAAWNSALRTHELIVLANREDRVFLTRNRRIQDAYPQPKATVLLLSTDPAAQLSQLTADLQLDVWRALFTKCIRCNVKLDTVPDKAAIRDRVHPHVYARHEQFFTCPSCGTVFWRGSHVANTCRKLGLRAILESDSHHKPGFGDG